MTILLIGPFFCPRNQSGSTGTVLLVDLFLAGFHGDSDAHPTPARCHAGHLAPGVRIWVVTLHAVQECVTIIASCGEKAEGTGRDGHCLLGWVGAGGVEREETRRSFPTVI